MSSAAKRSKPRRRKRGIKTRARESKGASDNSTTWPRNEAHYGIQESQGASLTLEMQTPIATETILKRDIDKEAPSGVRSDERLAAIDVLRGLAAVAVVLYHARAEFWVGLKQTWLEHGLGGAPDVWLAYALSAFSFGWIGVPVFFVLSGYCIHRSPASRLKSGDPFGWSTFAFYKRRIIRIYPVYIAALCLTAIIDYLNTNSPTALEATASNTTKTFLINLIMLQGILAPVFGTNSVFWTLSIEFHLYLFYPFVLWLIVTSGPTTALLFSAVVTSLFCGAYDYFEFEKSLGYSHGGSPVFLSHLLIWVAGAYLAEIEFGRGHLPTGAWWTTTWMACLLLGIALHQGGRFDWSPLPLAVGTLGLVDHALRTISCKPWLTSGAIGKALIGLGVISYSLYATHRISFGLITYLKLASRGTSVVTALYCSAIAVGFAAIFYRLIERYSIRR